MVLPKLRHLLTFCAGALMLGACAQTADTPIEKVDKSAAERIQAAMETARSTQGPGHPTLWSMGDDDTTIYLFGTAHLLPDGLDWKTETFQEAFDSADKVYMEIDPDAANDAQLMQSLVMEHGMFSDGTTLSSLLSEDEMAAVKAAAESVGLPVAGLDPVKPWFAGLQLSLVQMMKNGYNPNAGVEQILTAEAKASGKTFGHFETPVEQMLLLSGAPMEEQIEGLVFSAKSIDMGKDILDTLVEEWADGDVKGMGALMGEPDMFGTDSAYEKLIVTRNQNWIPQIEAILADPGVKFVAVGAGHLSGPDSVITMLRDKGHTVERVQ